MSVSAVSSFQPSGLPGSLVPVLPSENATTAAAASSTGAKDTKHLSMFADGDDSPSFMDLLDVINPLQHIPFINDLYQEATGDKIGVGARLVGGALFGGPIGLIGAAANCVLEESTGHDVGGHVLALFRGDSSGSEGTALASATEPNPAAAPEQTAKAAPQQLAAATPAQTADSSTAQPLILSDLVGAETLPNTTRQAAAPPPPAAAPLAPVQSAQSLDPTDAAQAVAAKANGAGRPMTIGGREPRFMPIPGRNTPMATQSPPAVGTSISTTGTRSNAPITGARPNTAAAVNPAMVQQMAAAQGGGVTPVQAGPTNDWFNASMTQALDKYERTAKMGKGSAASVADPQ